MYVYPSIDPDGCAHFIHNCNEFSMLQISEWVVNVKMFEIANHSVEGGVYRSQTRSCAQFECELR